MPIPRGVRRRKPSLFSYLWERHRPDPSLISGQALNQNGTSGRANSQVNKLNRQAGTERFSARVVKPNMPGRAKALKWEKGKVKGYKKANPTGDKPVGNIKPDPA